MKWIFIAFLHTFIFNNLYAKTFNELVEKISNSTPTMQYLFWVAKDSSSKNVPYLTQSKEGGGFAVWHFTLDKKWQPIHSANAFDGFPKAENVFDDISLDKIKEAITFGAITNNPTDDTANQKAVLLESKDFNIGWYFWVNTGDAFLFSESKSKGISIWYFTPDKKWQPIHNAGAFDGFDKADNTLENVSFEASSGVLTIGKSILDTNDTSDGNQPKENKPDLPKGITLKSNDVQEGEFLSEAYSSLSPAFSWDVQSDIKDKDIIKSYAISLKDLDVDKYHWNIINIPKSITSLPKGPLSNYENSRNIPNDFGTPSYLAPFPPAGETHNYKFTVYAFATSQISGTNDYNNAIYKSSITVKYTGK